MLPEDVFDRYQRQTGLPEIGLTGQRRLAGSSVLVVGAGGLGSPLLFALAGAGIGRIGICDPDEVSLSNLNRQFLYTPADLGRPKLERAIVRLQAYNPDICWQALVGPLDEQSAGAWLPEYDLVLAAVDNQATRQILNRACCARRQRLVDGGVRGFSGYLLSVNPGQSACYSCVFGPAETKADQAASRKPGGTLGATAGVIGNLEANLAIRLLLGLPDPLAGRLLVYHGSDSHCERIEIQRAPGCPACGHLAVDPAAGR